MPTNSESLNRELYRLLTKYKPKPLDAEGKTTPVPEEADVFKFEFTKDGDDYGTVYVTLDDDRVLTVYFGDDVSDSPSDRTPGIDYDDTWTGLLQQLSAWRMTKGLRGFKTQNKDRVNDDMARRNHMRNKDKIAEGYYPMGKSRSYSDAVPTVKIVIEHSRVIEEGEKRYRNINRIFLENQDGERYLLDTKKPGIARVYARHIAEGGKVNDDRWNHVHSLCEEYSKMAGFVRATRNGQFNESAQSLVNEGIAHYQSLRESLSRMTSKRGYNAYFESWTPSLMEDGTEENNLNELFVQETLDPRIESVMPILNRIHKKVSESVVDKEMNKLAEWADSLVEGEGESIQSNNPIGIPESLDQYSPVTQAITRRILMQHPDLLQKYGPEKVGDAIDSVAEFVGDVEEIGSSDVSGWVKQVAQSLGGHEGVAEEVDTGQYDAAKSTHKGGTTPEQEKEFRKKVQAYGKELEQRQKEKEKGMAEGSGDPEITPGMKTPYGTVVKVNGNTVTVKASNGELTTMNIHDIQQGVAEGDYADGSSIKTPGSEDWKQQYQQAVMAVKNAKTQQEYEAASDRAGRIKDLLASKGIQVGAVLGQQGVAEGSHEDQVASLASYNEKMAGENPPIDLGLREVGNWAKVGHYGDPIKTAWLNIAKYGVRNNRFKDSVDQVMSAISEFPDLEDEVYDMYDINQDEVDILSDAYETVYDQWEQSRGAANENFINQADQAVVSEEDEMAEGVLDAIKRGVAGAKQFGKEVKDATKQAWDEEIPKLKQDWKNPIKTAFAEEDEMDEGAHTQHYDAANKFTGDIDHSERSPTDWSTDPIEAGTDRIHNKISSMLKKLSKPKDNQDLDEAAAPWEDEADKEDDKKPKDTKGSDGSEHGGHSRAKHLAKNAIPKDEKKEVKEGQDDLDRILTIMNHRR